MVPENENVDESSDEKKNNIHSNLDLGVVLVSREMTPKSREILNQGFYVKFVITILHYKAQDDFIFRNFSHLM